MQNQGFPATTIARHELEETWRQRVEQAQHLYQIATAEYRKLLREEPDGRPPSPDSALARARQAESERLMEYSHMLRVFTDLTVHGTLPEEPPDALSKRVIATANMIAVVDDDESIRDSTRALLRSAGYQVATFESAEKFLDSDADAEAECVVLDVRMPGMDGLELQRRLNALGAGVPIIFLTAHDDARSRRLAMDGGAVDFLCKPFEANSLVTAVQTALTRHSVRRKSA
jgi:CheY-like chemotaxis protein